MQWLFGVYSRITRGKTQKSNVKSLFLITKCVSSPVFLVLYAINHGKQENLFVQKMPAVSIEPLERTILEMKHTDVGGHICIGTQCGENYMESLAAAEKMLRAKDLPSFFHIPG